LWSCCIVVLGSSLTATALGICSKETNMINLSSEEFKDLIHKSAALRGLGKFQEAIALVESKLTELDKDCYLNAYKEIFSAYKELGNYSKASEYAKKLFLIEPDLPSIQDFLKNN
jgi:tetratricopeptide (TPR) repeat protein